jgi:hypothetical protein
MNIKHLAAALVMSAVAVVAQADTPKNDLMKFEYPVASFQHFCVEEINGYLKKEVDKNSIFTQTVFSAHSISVVQGDSNEVYCTAIGDVINSHTKTKRSDVEFRIKILAQPFVSSIAMTPSK